MKWKNQSFCNIANGYRTHVNVQSVVKVIRSLIFHRLHRIAWHGIVDQLVLGTKEFFWFHFWMLHKNSMALRLKLIQDHFSKKKIIAKKCEIFIKIICKLPHHSQTIDCVLMSNAHSHSSRRRSINIKRST